MKEKIIAILVLVSLINIAGVVMADDISSAQHSSSTLTVTCTGAAPTIQWYNFTDSAGASKLDAEVDVSNVYNFTVRINHTNGWASIEYVNITAWYDNDTEATTYNQSTNLGGNLNMFLQYKNTTGTAEWSMLWPVSGEEATFGTYNEAVIDSMTHNLTFRFTPGNQIRHTPGTPAAGAGLNWVKSWNFNISVIDTGNLKAWELNEYGIYMYSAISSAGSPSMSGAPGSIATASAISVVTVSNGNYSLYVNVSDLSGPETIDNTTIGVAGGDLSETHFDDVNPLYIYGSVSTYKFREASGTSKTTSDVIFHCDIPIGKTTGDYTSNVYYYLTTQNA